MRHALALLLLSFPGLVSAQNSRPQLKWSGYITGGATLFIQANRTDVQGRQTGAVDRPRAQFTSPLPASPTQVTMEVRRGGGKVQIVEQPVASNEFSAVVQITPGGRDPELYELEFYWDRGEQTRSRPAAVSPGRGELRWSGEVEGEIVVEVAGQRASSRVVRGQSVIGERIDITSPMLASAGTVQLQDVKGRGQVELLQQPRADNNFTAVVRVRDTGSSRAPYSFRLVWEGGGSSSAAAAETKDHYARWSGRVDGKVRVTLQGNRAVVTTVQGKPVTGMNVDFRNGPGLPADGAKDVQLRKLKGRGDVHVIPNTGGGNDAALVFDIEDKGSGDDLYEVEITWK